MAQNTRTDAASDLRSRFVRIEDAEGAFKRFHVVRGEKVLGVMAQVARGGAWTFTGPRKSDKPEEIGRTKFDAMRALRERDPAPEPQAVEPAAA